MLHITTSKQTRHLGVIGIIDHKSTIAIFHALVNILGDFLRIRRIKKKLRSIRLHFNVVGHCIAEHIRCLYAFDTTTFACHFSCFTVMTVSSDLWRKEKRPLSL